MENGINWKVVVLVIGLAALNTLAICWYAVEKSKHENPWIKTESEITGIRP